MRFLVADDSLQYQTMLKSMLEPWGCEVVLAADGHEAQSILDSDDAPQLAILGCSMPGLSGLELCERIRARKRGYVYMILLSSASGDGLLVIDNQNLCSCISHGHVLFAV